MVGETLEDQVELAGRLTGGDHRGKNWTEDGRLGRERVRQARPALNLVTHPQQRVTDRLIAQVFGGESQGPVERQAGPEQGRGVAGPQRQSGPGSGSRPTAGQAAGRLLVHSNRVQTLPVKGLEHGLA
jgi:hypothetical protein